MLKTISHQSNSHSTEHSLVASCCSLPQISYCVLKRNMIVEQFKIFVGLGLQIQMEFGVDQKQTSLFLSAAVAN